MSLYLDQCHTSFADWIFLCLMSDKMRNSCIRSLFEVAHCIKFTCVTHLSIHRCTGGDEAQEEQLIVYGVNQNRMFIKTFFKTDECFSTVDEDRALLRYV